MASGRNEHEQISSQKADGEAFPSSSIRTLPRQSPPSSLPMPITTRGRALEYSPPSNRMGSRDSSLSSTGADSAKGSPSKSDRLKSFGTMIKRKGKHLKEKSITLLGRPSTPIGSSNPAEDEQKMTEQFTDLAVDAPSAPVTANTTSNVPLEPGQTSEAAQTLSANSQHSRKPSFRHEHYPRLRTSTSPDQAMAGRARDQTGGLTSPTTPGSATYANIRVPALLQQGTPMNKISAKKLKTRIFRIDPKLGQIRWESNSAGISQLFAVSLNLVTIVGPYKIYFTVPLDSIIEVRSGPEISFYLTQFHISQDREALWLTIIYTPPRTSSKQTYAKYKTLHLIAYTREVFLLWRDTLNHALEYRNDMLSGKASEDPVAKGNVWDKQFWNDTERNGDKVIDFEEIEGMCRRLNISLPRANLLNVFCVSTEITTVVLK